MSWAFARSLELQRFFHRDRLSSRRFTPVSSAKYWSKQLTGARKMTEFISSKLEHHTFRYHKTTLLLSNNTWLRGRMRLTNDLEPQTSYNIQSSTVFSDKQSAKVPR